jgi:hypothetical protein
MALNTTVWDGAEFHKLKGNSDGELYMALYPGTGWCANTTQTGAVTTGQIVAAPGTGLCLYITDILVTNDSTAAITFNLIEGTTTSLTGAQKIPTSGGFILNLRKPIRLAANTKLSYTTTGTSNYTIFINGYTSS